MISTASRNICTWEINVAFYSTDAADIYQLKKTSEYLEVTNLPYNRQSYFQQKKCRENNEKGFIQYN
jgi:hypothetical protein